MKSKEGVFFYYTVAVIDVAGILKFIYIYIYSSVVTFFKIQLTSRYTSTFLRPSLPKKHTIDAFINKKMLLIDVKDKRN